MSDNIILYPAPLVLPGASRFDQLLALTERLTKAAEHSPALPQEQITACVTNLQAFLTADTITQQSPSHPASQTSTAPPATNPSLQPAVVPVTSTTRHRPSSDTGADLIG